MVERRTVSRSVMMRSVESIYTSSNFFFVISFLRKQGWSAEAMAPGGVLIYGCNM